MIKNNLLETKKKFVSQPENQHVDRAGLKIVISYISDWKGLIWKSAQKSIMHRIPPKVTNQLSDHKSDNKSHISYYKDKHDSQITNWHHNRIKLNVISQKKRTSFWEWPKPKNQKVELLIEQH